MKKILIYFLLMTIISSIKLNAYTDTGHDDFMEIIPKNEEVAILNEMPTIQKNVALKKVKKAFFWGWRTSYLHIDEKMDYIGKIIFSRTNQSSSDITFSYNLKESISETKSFNISDSLTVKGSGGKKIDVSLANELEVDYSAESTTSIVETLSYDITVPSGKKVTMYTTGEGKITNGCSAKYIFFIRVKYGFWEVVEVKTVYYKIVEEEL